MYKLIRNIGFLAVLLGLGLVSCDEDYPKSHIAPYDTELLSIKITNAGADGNTVVEGTIDEDNKIINFPRLDMTTNFSALNLDAKLSDGATLQNSVLDFSMDEETASKTLVLRIVNQKRYKEYFIRVRKRIPVYGADFEKPTVYDFSGDNIYPDYGSLLTRCASYDGEHVLIVSRKTAPHLLKVSELKKGEIKPIMLDLTGVTGGTYSYNMGALTNGHVYIASLSGSQASPLKIYYWDTPTSKPEVIADIKVSDIPGAGNRHGDNISVNIDKNGNGFLDYVEYDMDGDGKFETVFDLKALGIDDRAKLIDVSSFTYRDYTKMMKRMSDGIWERAQTAVRVAHKYGLNTSWYAWWIEALSMREKYHRGYWLQYYLFQDLMNYGLRTGDRDLQQKLVVAYCSGNWKSLL